MNMLNLIIALSVIPVQSMAGKEADRPKFRAGQFVRINSCANGAYTYRSCNNYIAEDKCFETKGCVWHDCAYKSCHPYAGKKGKIISQHERVCASTAGDPRVAGIDSCDTYSYEVDVGRERFLISESLLMVIK